ncbi:2-oxoacid:acceptor oxidoreductase family protein [Kribbella sp. NPDC020789]
MYEVRVHGRGGQGVVTTAELLSVAAFAGGREAQAFPTFGSERTGAPVVGFCRIDDRPIRSHEPVAEPDAVILQDATLIGLLGVFDGLKPTGVVLVNTSWSLAELGLDLSRIACPPEHVVTIAATDLALRHLGRPLPGAALIGAFAALTGQVGAAEVEIAIRERFDAATADGNVAAARAAYQVVRRQLEGASHA